MHKRGRSAGPGIDIGAVERQVDDVSPTELIIQDGFEG